MLSSTVCFVITENGYAAENHIYVKNSYPYDTGDGSANRPYQSIQKAIDLAQDGESQKGFPSLDLINEIPQ